MQMRHRRLLKGSMGGMWMGGILWFSLQNMDRTLNEFIKEELLRQFQRRGAGQEAVALDPGTETVTERGIIGGEVVVEAEVGTRVTGTMIEKGIIAAAAAVQALITLEAVVEMIEGVEVSRMTVPHLLGIVLVLKGA